MLRKRFWGVVGDSGSPVEAETPRDLNDLQQPRTNRCKAARTRIRGKTTRERESALRAAENSDWRSRKPRCILEHDRLDEVAMVGVRPGGNEAMPKSSELDLAECYGKGPSRRLSAAT